MFYLFWLPPIAVQVLLIFHGIKTGSERYWIFILVFIPLGGSLDYFFVEILPPLLASPKKTKLRSRIGDSINPGRKIANDWPTSTGTAGSTSMRSLSTKAV
jgi:hypothetical protein